MLPGKKEAVWRKVVLNEKKECAIIAGTIWNRRMCK